jgi:hypothetical protein
MTGLKPQDAAATEAAEEAGIVGEVEDRRSAPTATTSA